MTIILNIFFFETTLHIKVKISCGVFVGKGTCIYKNSLGHMTKMAIMLIYGKYHYNFILWNQKFNDLETRHGPSGTQVLQSSYKR